MLAEIFFIFPENVVFYEQVRLIWSYIIETILYKINGMV